MASVYVADSTKITDDPFFKIRPIFSELSQSYKIMPFQESLSMDESMILERATDGGVAVPGPESRRGPVGPLTFQYSV